MANTKKDHISDSPSEDMGYNRNHRQTCGGLQAYQRGELPISYWNKKKIMSYVVETFLKMKRDKKYYAMYKNLLTKLNMSEEEIIEQVSKQNLSTLKSTLLEYRGAHYTGNFYRYTKFYGIVRPITLLIRVKNKLVKPREIVQLMLNIGV